MKNGQDDFERAALRRFLAKVLVEEVKPLKPSQASTLAGLNKDWLSGLSGRIPTLDNLVKFCKSHALDIQDVINRTLELHGNSFT